MSTAPTARHQFPELVELDAAFTALHADTPTIPSLGIDTAFSGRYDAWTTRRDALVIQRDIVLVRLSRYLCAPVRGHRPHRAWPPPRRHVLPVRRRRLDGRRAPVRALEPHHERT